MNTFQIAGDQIIGARTQQEDSLKLQEIDSGAQQLLLVADGMGGHAGGAQASQIVAESFVEAYLGDEGGIVDRLQDALFYANDQIAAAIEAEPALLDMGTTLLAVVVEGDELSWLSVGDSILWVYRDSALLRINDDHSMAPVIDGLVEIGRMTPEQAALDPRRNQLRSVVTGEEIPMIDVSRSPFRLADGDIVLLASDGILTLAEDEITGLLGENSNSTPARYVAMLLDAVSAHAVPQQDNTTLAVAAQT